MYFHSISTMYTYNVESHTFVVNFQRGKSKRKKKCLRTQKLKKNPLLFYSMFYEVYFHSIFIYITYCMMNESHTFVVNIEKEENKKEKTKSLWNPSKFPTP